METNNLTLNTETGVETTQSDLDFLLSQYTKPATVVEPVINDQPKQPENIQPQPSQQTTTIQQPVNTDSNAPYGYYQRGKKKGQPRITPYISIKGGQQLPPPIQQQPQDVKLSGMLIDGGLFLTLINLVIPMFMTLANNYWSEPKIKAEQLQLTKDQLRELDPVCDAVMKQVSMTGNPLVLLFIGLFAAFGLNLMAAKMDSKFNPNKK